MTTKHINWDQEKTDFLRAHCRNYTDREAAILFNLQFGTDVDHNLLNSTRKRFSIETGRNGRFEKGLTPWNKGKSYTAGGRSPETRFKRGGTPPNTAPIGTIVEDRDGYLKQKISDDQIPARFNWKYMNVLKWEQYHGREVPKGHCVRFVDLDKRNFDENNLVLVSQGENAVINRWSSLENFPEEARAIVITMVKIKILANQRERDRRKQDEKGAAITHFCELLG